MNRGVTLVELVVALSLLGLIVGMSGVAVVTLRLPQQSEAHRELERARAVAIRTGHPTPDTGHRVLFLPDGRAVGPGVDPLTGAFLANRK